MFESYDIDFYSYLVIASTSGVVVANFRRIRPQPPNAEYFMTSPCFITKSRLSDDRTLSARSCTNQKDDSPETLIDEDQWQSGVEIQGITTGVRFNVKWKRAIAVDFPTSNHDLLQDQSRSWSNLAYEPNFIFASFVFKLQRRQNEKLQLTKIPPSTIIGNGC